MSEQTKVTLPRNVAETIESYWSRWSAEAHLKHVKLTDWIGIAARDHEAHDILIAYAKERPIEYMTALVNGYEVEQTPEDKVREKFKQRKQNAIETQSNYSLGYTDAVIEVLDALNIKIKGVNEE